MGNNNSCASESRTRTKSWDGEKDDKIIALFDVDGTLSLPRKKAPDEMIEFLEELRERIYIGVVGGSDFPKQKEQLGDDALERFDYNFAENGLVAYREGRALKGESLKTFLGEEKIQTFINFTLSYLSKVKCPVKRGNFIEFRNGMMNVSPCGRNVNQEERDAFEEYDKKQNVRKEMVKVLEKEFKDYGLTFAIGGQISFDVFPNGWDKTYCLRHLEDMKFEQIHFFGDKTHKGGNDYEIFESNETIGHTVTGPEDTIAQCRKLFM